MALNLEGAKVNGSVYVTGDGKSQSNDKTRQANVDGEFSLVGAAIGQHVYCEGAYLKDSEKHDGNETESKGEQHAIAVRADHLSVAGSFVLRNTTVEGRIRLATARIGGHFDCRGSTLTGTRHTGEEGRVALWAPNISVEGSVFLGVNIRRENAGFSADGTISLFNARIGGNLWCTGSTLNLETADVREHSAPDIKAVPQAQVLARQRYALDADAAQIEGSVNIVGTPEPGQRIYRGGSTVRGGVCFARTRIGGDIRCAGSDIRANPAGIAFNLDEARVGGSLYMIREPEDASEKRGKLTLEGTLSLAGTDIRHHFFCRGADFKFSQSGDGVAIFARTLHVGGNVLIGSTGEKMEEPDRVTVCGSTRMRYAWIGGSLVLGHVTLCIDSRKSRLSLDGRGIRIGGTLGLRNVKAYGNIDLSRASVRERLTIRWTTAHSDIDCTEVRVDGDILVDPEDLEVQSERNVPGDTNNWSGTDHSEFDGQINLSAARVVGDLSLGPSNKASAAGSTCCGQVSLTGIQVGGDLTFANVIFAPNTGDRKVKVKLDCMDVSGRFDWKPNFPKGTRLELDVDLTNSKVGTFVHNDKDWYWNDCNSPLHLVGFSYASWVGNTAVKELKHWLALDEQKTTDSARESFSVQPYEQLAKALTNAGHNHEARIIRIEESRRAWGKENLQGSGKLLWRLLGFFYWLFVGYGYRPALALAWSLGIILIGWGLFWFGNQHNQMQRTTLFGITSADKRGRADPVEVLLRDPDKTNALESVRLTEDPREEFDPLVYSVVTFVPLASDFRERNDWSPGPDDKERAVFWIGLSWPPCGLLSQQSARDLGPHVLHKEFWILLLYWGYFEIGSGWILTALFATGLAQIMRTESP